MILGRYCTVFLLSSALLMKKDEKEMVEGETGGTRPFLLPEPLTPRGLTRCFGLSQIFKPCLCCCDEAVTGVEDTQLERQFIKNGRHIFGQAGPIPFRTSAVEGRPRDKLRAAHTFGFSFSVCQP